PSPSQASGSARGRAAARERVSAGERAAARERVSAGERAAARERVSAGERAAASAGGAGRGLQLPPPTSSQIRPKPNRNRPKTVRRIPPNNPSARRTALCDTSRTLRQVATRYSSNAPPRIIPAPRTVMITFSRIPPPTWRHGEVAGRKAQTSKRRQAGAREGGQAGTCGRERG